VPTKKKAVAKNGPSANLDYEQEPWPAADKMCGHMDSVEYKHVVLGLTLLVSDPFQAPHEALKAKLTPGRYVGAEDVADEDGPFLNKMRRLTTQLEQQSVERMCLENQFRGNFKLFAWQK